MIINLLGALGGFLILYTTVFSSHHTKTLQSNKHEQVGNSLNLLYKRIRQLEASSMDGIIQLKVLNKRLDEFSTEYSALMQAAPVTFFSDFETAREDFKKGFSSYTEEELLI